MKKLSYSFVLLVIALAVIAAPNARSYANSGGGQPFVYLPVVFRSGLAEGGLVIDHNTADIAKIPASYIDAARSTIRASYGHTSHGSQIVTGMQYWMKVNSRYALVTDGSLQSGFFSMDDTTPGGDLGSGDWAAATRAYLKSAGADRNLVMWSWCGQLEGYSSGQVQQYLSDMNQLEKEFPAVRFVYMTQHTVWNEDPANNDIVRSYARANNKILFDFADMEKFTPEGAAVPLSQVSDSCPWCQNYCNTHAAYCSDLNNYMDDCAHTEKLLCKIKSQAAWWMLARLAGWDGTAAQ